MPSFTEENYLKAIYKLAERGTEPAVSTNAIAEVLHTRAASVSDMLRRLSEKGTVHYEKYRGVRLTEAGRRIAVQTIRKHRLWEVFLVEKLNFSWDEVHEVAEELEHLHSPVLFERLDAFLGHPAFDPHGDPIPTASGHIQPRAADLCRLADLPPATTPARVAALADTSAAFLQHLDQLGLRPGARVVVLARYPYDGTTRLRLTESGEEIVVSRTTTENVMVER